MPDRLTTQDVWISTIIFGVVATILVIPLQFLYQDSQFHQSMWPIAISSALFWGILTLIFMLGFWELYYQYFYPSWIRRLAPVNLFLYAGFGMGLWYVVASTGFPNILGFAIVGGLQGIAEHLFAVYILRVLEKVPILEGLTPAPVIIFSFFEYAAYWTIVAWISFGVFKWLFQ